MALCTPDEIRSISLCSGLGALDLGLAIAEPRTRTVCYVEQNAYCAATLMARMEDKALHQAPIWDDMRTFDGRPWRGKVHCLTGGYPCQPFSYSGLRRGKDDPRHLWSEITRVIRETQPQFCFFENVLGHLSLGFQEVVQDFQGLGFRVAARVVSAAEVGGSHTRERLFILAHANGERNGEPCGHSNEQIGPFLQTELQQLGHSTRNRERGKGVGADVGLVDGGGLDAAEFHPFPPEPSDFIEWGKALGQNPAIKPGLHGLADGMAHRVERCTAAGNGVVPLAAAHAFCMLRAELESIGA